MTNSSERIPGASPSPDKFEEERKTLKESWILEGAGTDFENRVIWQWKNIETYLPTLGAGFPLTLAKVIKKAEAYEYGGDQMTDEKRDAYRRHLLFYMEELRQLLSSLSLGKEMGHFDEAYVANTFNHMEFVGVNQLYQDVEGQYLEREAVASIEAIAKAIVPYQEAIQQNGKLTIKDLTSDDADVQELGKALSRYTSVQQRMMTD